jgi:hypothetical protein
MEKGEGTTRCKPHSSISASPFLPSSSSSSSFTLVLPQHVEHVDSEVPGGHSLLLPGLPEALVFVVTVSVLVVVRVPVPLLLLRLRAGLLELLLFLPLPGLVALRPSLQGDDLRQVRVVLPVSCGSVK